MRCLDTLQSSPRGLCKRSITRFIFGGWDGKKCLNDFYEFSLEASIWYNISLNSVGQRPSPRYRLDGCEIGGRLYFFGGVNNEQKKFNTLYEYDPEVREWAVIEGSGEIPTARSFLRVLPHQNLLVLAGGVDETKKNDVYLVSMPVRHRTTIRKKSSVSVASLSGNASPDISKSPKENLNHSLSYYKLLNDQILELSKKLKEEQMARLCKICRSQEIDSMYLECCHCVACFQCGVKEALVISCPNVVHYLQVTSAQSYKNLLK